MRHRLRTLGYADANDRVVEHSVLDLPHPDESLECVVSIGCLHHTGALPRAVAEVERVLRPGGTAVAMLYNRHSLRRLSLGIRGRIGRTTNADVRRLRCEYAGDSRAPYRFRLARGRPAPVRGVLVGSSTRREL